MNVLVDTSVWSIALRRNNLEAKFFNIVDELTELIEENRAVLCGPIIQELLSGIKSAAQFNKLKTHLKPYDELTIGYDDYVTAAQLFNKCRTKGVQGSHIDFLICAIAMRQRIPLFTVDQDFTHYAKHFKLRLHLPRKL